MTTWALIKADDEAQRPLNPADLSGSIFLAVLPQAVAGLVLFFLLWAIQQITRTGWRVFWTATFAVLGAVAGALWGFVVFILTALESTDQEVW